MYLATNTKPVDAFQVRLRADHVAETISSSQEDQTLIKLMRKIYPDLPNASKGSRKVLLSSLRRALLVGDIENVIEIHKAVANFARLTCDAFKDCPDTNEELLHNALHSFLWWSDMFRRVEIEINRYSGKRAA
jgi:hypothetical protein